jgi:YVTN family beta-propeller protein
MRRASIYGKLLPAGTIFILLEIILSGCTTSAPRQEKIPEGHGQVTIYVNSASMVENDITFRLDAVNIISRDGTEEELLDTPVTINSVRNAGRQMQLLEKYVPEGKYEKLVFEVGEASIRKQDRVASLALPEQGIERNIQLAVGKAQNTTLFIDWLPDSSVTDGYLFSPELVLREQAPQVSALLLYVTNEGSNNVSVIRKPSDEVVGTVLVGEKPRGVAAGSLQSDLRVYVANAGSNTVTVINPATNKVDNTIPVRFGLEPVDIAVYPVAPDREILYIANYGSRNVSIIDSRNYQEIGRVITGDGPIAIASDPPVDELHGSRFFAAEDMTVLRNFRTRHFFVYVANRNSNTVSVLRMNKEGDRVEEVINLDVEWEPVALAVDYQRGTVYVASHGSENVSIIDIVQVVKGNTKQAVTIINNMGRSITDILPDRGFDRIYVLKDIPAEMTVFRLSGRELSSGSTPPVAGIIPFTGTPRSMVLDQETGRIYVVNRQRNSIVVVDRTTVKKKKVIPVGKNPYDIAIITPSGR